MNVSDTEILASCSNCVYFRVGGHHANKEGVCRRNPPSQWNDETEPEQENSEPEQSEDGGWSMSTVTILGGRSYTGWPDVNAHDWCGDHRLR